MITFTIDLEDPTERYAPTGRYVFLTQNILDLCDELGCKATFFTVGRVGEAVPDLIKSIAAKGHEIAYHSHAHVPLTRENPDRFLRESRADKDRLEQLTGQNVIGFRAPRFSLTPDSVWALDILKELGFLYSSSVMPTDVSLFGFPGLECAPFTWPNGIKELPLPVADIGKLRLPYLGGIYLYATPFFLVRHWLGKARANEVLWTYTHPYDFDRDETFSRMANASLGISLILWLARRRARKQIRRLLDAASLAPPLRDRLDF